MQAHNEAAAIDQAVAFLLKQAAGWKTPDADAARALVLAAAKGHTVGTAIDPVLAYLKQPAKWPAAGRVGLGYALAAAERHGKAASTDLEAAAKLITAEQQQDGSYGGSLFDTWRARATLVASGIQPDEVWVILIDRWVRGATAETVTEAALLLLALDLAGDMMAENQRREALQLIRRTHKPGPPFETALVVLALTMLEAEPRMARSTYRPEELKAAVAQGRAALMGAQRPDGSWPGAPRDTAWALMALL